MCVASPSRRERRKYGTFIRNTHYEILCRQYPIYMYKSVSHVYEHLSIPCVCISVHASVRMYYVHTYMQFYTYILHTTHYILYDVRVSLCRWSRNGSAGRSTARRPRRTRRREREKRKKTRGGGWRREREFSEFCSPEKKVHTYVRIHIQLIPIYSPLLYLPNLAISHDSQYRYDPQSVMYCIQLIYQTYQFPIFLNY